MPESAAEYIAEAEDLLTKISSALQIVTPEGSMNSHTVWEVQEMLDVLTPSDFTAMEMMAMAVVLAVVNTRRLTSGPTLRLLSHPA